MSGAVSTISNYMNLFGANRPALPGGTGTPVSGSSVFPTDSLTLSPSAQMLQQFLSTDIQAPGESGELDLTGLAQLKQRGDMLANMLQMKLKNFESSLIASMKSAGMDASQDMSIKDGDQGLLLMENIPGKEGMEQFLNKSGNWQEQFQEIAKLAQLMETLQQAGSRQGAAEGIQGNPALRYVQQSLSDPAMKSSADFVIRFLQGHASFSFE